MKAAIAAKGRKPLSERQQQIYWFILEYTKQYNMPPTVREIGARFGIKSPNGPQQHIRAMIKKGWLHRPNGRHRGLFPVDTTNKCPLCGSCRK